MITGIDVKTIHMKLKLMMSDGVFFSSVHSHSNEDILKASLDLGK